MVYLVLLALFVHSIPSPSHQCKRFVLSSPAKTRCHSGTTYRGWEPVLCLSKLEKLVLQQALAPNWQWNCPGREGVLVTAVAVGPRMSPVLWQDNKIFPSLLLRLQSKRQSFQHPHHGFFFFFKKSSVGDRHFPYEHLSLWPFHCPFWLVIEISFRIYWEICRLWARRLKLPVSSSKLKVCSPQALPSFTPSSLLVCSRAFVRGIILGESSVD